MNKLEFNCSYYYRAFQSKYIFCRIIKEAKFKDVSLMNKLDYLFETRSGQLSKYYARMRKNFCMDITMEPKSKNSITISQKRKFQWSVLQELEKNNKRAFSGPIAIELDFYPTENNPSHIHSLPKNYLDLLGKPLQKSKRKNLLFKDDRQVEMLIVNYHIERRNKNPLISIKAVSMHNLKQDLMLLHKIRHNSFQYEDELIYDFNDLLDEDNTSELISNLDEAVIQNHELKTREDFFDQETYENMMKINLYNIQSSLFSLDKIRPLDLLSLYPDITKRVYPVLPSHQFMTLNEQSRRLIISPPFSPLNSHTLPNEMRGKKEFKKEIRESMIEFKKKYHFISPLLINISLTILYIPPNRYEEVDLDNLARYIIPQVNEILKPTGKRFFAEEREKGFTQNSITQYQVIRIPRVESDPEEGIAQLVINNKKTSTSILNDLDSIIDRWKDID